MSSDNEKHHTDDAIVNVSIAERINSNDIPLFERDDAVLVPEEKRSVSFFAHPITWIKSTIDVIIRTGRVNLLLVFFIPAVVMKHYDSNQVLLTIFNFLSIIPLSNLMTTGIDDLTARVGPACASVLHALSGNCVELFIEFYALVDERYAIVRSAILGSILCNITLVLGVAFLAGAWPTKKRLRSSFNTKDASFQAKLFVDTTSSILALAVLALVTPAAFKIATPLSEEISAQSIECNIQNISHATAIILMLVYFGLLVFQLKTHVKEVIDAKEYKCEAPSYPWYFDLFLIGASVAGISFCARYLVTSIENIAEEYELGTGFVGIVLFPLCVVSNFIEHYTAIKDAYSDRVDTAISLILNTSVQMALLVTPILVLVGWAMGHPLTLDFNVLEISVLGCAVLIVNYLVADNRANWLEGYMLVVSYFLIAITFFYFPTPHDDDKRKYHCKIWSRNLNTTSTLNNEH